jgi:hypothetical protein
MSSSPVRYFYDVEKIKASIILPALYSTKDRDSTELNT